MTKDRFSICVACGMSFSRGLGKPKKVCSDECGRKVIHKVSACAPRCDDNDQGYREIVFKNGRVGGQRYCLRCKQTKVVARKALQ